MVARKSAAKQSSVEETKRPARRKRKSVDDGVEAKVEFFNPLADIHDRLDGIEKDYSLSGATISSDEAKQSTGMLGLDLVLSQGLLPGWYTVFGPEQSCKSTTCATLMAACLNSSVPIISMWDYEGSSSAEYLENILKVNGIKSSIEHIFGVRDPKTSKWTVAPRVRYYSEGVAEKFFDYLAKLERVLPDKLIMGDTWYYVYEDTKDNRKIVGDRFDKDYWRKTKKLRVEAPDGTLQAIVFVDSYPAMLPERLDVDDPGSGMAAQARMFAEQLKRVKGKLRSKRICVVGVNQLRQRPAVMYGDPSYEPGGDSLKFFSDVRLRSTPRALSSVPGIKGKGMIMEEESATVDGGVDTYRFIHIRAHKNKLSVPNLECWMRLWITDGNGEAMGFDPVWDTYMYLKSTNQISGKMNQLKISMDKHTATKALTWIGFKTLILGTRAEIKDVCTAIGLKPFMLRDACFKQLSSGKGLELYFDSKRSKEKEEEDEPDESDDE